MPSERKITKDNIFELLKDFAKEYRKENKNTPLELIIVGGGSIVLNYGFREMTYDIDAATKSLSEIKSAINSVADKKGLPNDWLNTDFMSTASYSDKLREVSKHYCTLNNGTINIRTVNNEYLIAMKMIAARSYRGDLSDIVGIIKYMKENNELITHDKLNDAIEKLYGDIHIDKRVKEFVYQCIDMNIEQLTYTYNTLIKENDIVNNKLIELSNEQQLTAESATEIAQKIRNQLEIANNLDHKRHGYDIGE